MMAGFDVFCWACSAQGTVNKLTATLRCGCGSDEVDLWQDSPEQRQRVAALQAPALSFADFMLRQGARPDTLPGWNEYQGPMPGPNVMSPGQPGPFEEGQTCPVCHGSGFDPQDGVKCRECGGSGKITPNTTPEPPAVARHQYPSTQTKVPFMGQKKVAAESVEHWLTENVPDYNATPRAKAAEYPRADSHSPNIRTWKPMDYVHQNKPLPLPEDASCPVGGCHQPTHLQRDYKDDAWWMCPRHGPLANVDRSHVNPFAPGEDFTPNGRNFKAARKLFSGKKTGTLLARIGVIAEHNPGLSPCEVVTLAIKSVRAYAEAR